MARKYKKNKKLYRIQKIEKILDYEASDVTNHDVNQYFLDVNLFDVTYNKQFN